MKLSTLLKDFDQMPLNKQIEQAANILVHLSKKAERLSIKRVGSENMELDIVKERLYTGLEQDHKWLSIDEIKSELNLPYLSNTRIGKALNICGYQMKRMKKSGVTKNAYLVCVNTQHQNRRIGR